MEKYKLFFRKSAFKELEGIPSVFLKSILTRIEFLSEDPRPQGCLKLSTKELYRLRQGDYRIIYSVDEDEKTITITKIGHRREVYR